MKHPSDMPVSPLRKQAADALRRARKLPVGSDRNDLRQLAVGLLWLEKQRLIATARDHTAAPKAPQDPQG
jgi:hypothetical protein